MSKTAIIVGAGIGGVTSAIALARAGWTVRILEQAPQISEVGAGLQISPNGMKVLHALGVAPHLEPYLFEPETIEMVLGDTGHRIFSIPMKAKAQDRWGARFVQVHRADLLGALVARLMELTGDVIETNVTVSGYRKHSDGVQIITEAEEFHADLLIGADGIHSQIRTQMLGDDAPKFTGNYAWRAVVPAASLGDHCPPPNGCIWALPGKHAITTRIRGGEMVNFVGIVESDKWEQEGWSIKGSTAEAMVDFGGLHPTLDAIINTASPLYRWALLNRAPLPRWSDGPVTLLGDAAHPMLPSMAQGAVQAIEDGYFLAQHLESTKDISGACSAFYQSRIERVTRVQRQSMANLNLFHKRGLASRALHYGPMWMADRLIPSVYLRKTDWIYGYPIPE